MKKIFGLSLSLFLFSLLINCKETTTFSPGAGDTRITGTWRLVERRFQKDSVKINDRDTVITQRDTGTVRKGDNLVKFDTLRKVRQVIRTYQNLTIDTTLRYAANPPQTLTFNGDGSLSASGSQMTYYNPIRYYRLDKTYSDSLSIDFFISTNRAVLPFRQGLSVQGDVLTLLPRCDLPCYSKFQRVR